MATHARTTKRIDPASACPTARTASRRASRASHGLVKPVGKDVHELALVRHAQLPAVLAREPVQARLGVAQREPALRGRVGDREIGDAAPIFGTSARSSAFRASGASIVLTVLTRAASNISSARSCRAGQTLPPEAQKSKPANPSSPTSPPRRARPSSPAAATPDPSRARPSPRAPAASRDSREAAEDVAREQTEQYVANHHPSRPSSAVVLRRAPSAARAAGWCAIRSRASRSSVMPGSTLCQVEAPLGCGSAMTSTVAP